MLDSLLGQQVGIVVTEPWELGGSGPLSGIIVAVPNDVERDAIVVELRGPLAYQGKQYTRFLVQARHAEARVRSLREGKTITASLTPVSAKTMDSDAEFSVDHWRGGLGIIGDVFVTA